MSNWKRQNVRKTKKQELNVDERMQVSVNQGIGFTRRYLFFPRVLQFYILGGVHLMKRKGN